MVRKRKSKGKPIMISPEIWSKWINGLQPPEGYLHKYHSKLKRSLEKIDLPNKQKESYRLTDSRKLENLLSLPIYSWENDNRIKKLPGIEESVVRFILDSSSKMINEKKLPKGFQVLDEKEIEDFLLNKPTNKSNNEDWQMLVNNASCNKILGLQIKGQTHHKLEIIIPEIENFTKSTRFLLILDNETELELLEVILGSGLSAHSHQIEIYLNKGSKLKHHFLALGKENSNMLANINVKQYPDSNYELTSLKLGWDLSRLETRIYQEEGKANTQIKGLQISGRSEQSSTLSSVYFNGPNGKLSQLNKSLATKKSHCIFNGEIKVPQIAQQTNASQMSRNLILSKRARIDTKPQLEIIADDVKCQHGATVSQLREDESFYLRSRGIDNKKATKLLLKAFYKEILEDLPFSTQNWNLINEIDQCIGA